MLEALLSRGIDAFSIDMGVDRIAQLQAAKFDRAFIIEHGGFGEDGRLQALLEIMGKPFTGSSSAACALAMDKQTTKHIWRGLSLPVADSVILQADSDFGQVYDRLGPKIMVKPVSEGSSVGNFIVHSSVQLEQAITMRRNSATLWPKHLSKAQNLPSRFAGPSVASHPYRIRSREYTTTPLNTRLETRCTTFPVGSGAEQERELQALALSANQALGCSGWSRVDFIQGPEGFVLLEVNTVPGMSATSLVPKAAAADRFGLPGSVRKRFWRLPAAKRRQGARRVRKLSLPRFSLPRIPMPRLALNFWGVVLCALMGLFGSAAVIASQHLLGDFEVSRVEVEGDHAAPAPRSSQRAPRRSCC